MGKVRYSEIYVGSEDQPDGMCGVEIRLGGVNLFVNKLKEQKLDESGKRSCQLSDII